MSALTKEALAAMLNGREYGSEIIHAEEVMAKQAGLVVVFGYSDDNMELRGAISDELDCCDSANFKIGKLGVLKDWESIDHEDIDEAREWFRCEAEAKNNLRAIWCPKDLPGYSWAYKLDVPHATFDIMEEGSAYCRGMVFALADLGAQHTPGDDAIMTGGAE